MVDLLKSFLGLALAVVFVFVATSLAQEIYRVGGPEQTGGMTDAPDGLITTQPPSTPPAGQTGAPLVGDPAAGEAIFTRCRACHRLDGTNAVGPYLDGVVGRKIASVGGFAYSAALRRHEGVWDGPTLDDWLRDPRAFALGNKMAFPGLRRAQDRADIVAYLATQ